MGREYHKSCDEGKEIREMSIVTQHEIERRMKVSTQLSSGSSGVNRSEVDEAEEVICTAPTLLDKVPSTSLASFLGVSGLKDEAYVLENGALENGKRIGAVARNGICCRTVFVHA